MLRHSEKRRCAYALHRLPVDAALDFQSRLRIYRLQGGDATLDVASIGDARHANVDARAGDFGHDVGTRSALDNAGGESYAALRICHFFNAKDLPRQLRDGVDAGCRVDSGMCRSTVNRETEFADTFASGLERARSGCGFEH